MKFETFQIRLVSEVVSKDASAFRGTHYAYLISDRHLTFSYPLNIKY